MKSSATETRPPSRIIAFHGLFRPCMCVQYIRTNACFSHRCRHVACRLILSHLMTNDTIQNPGNKDRDASSSRSRDPKNARARVAGRPFLLPLQRAWDLFTVSSFVDIASLQPWHPKREGQ